MAPVSWRYRVILARLPFLAGRDAPKDRLWIVEKPLWEFGCIVAVLAGIAARTWRWILKILNKDVIGFAVLCFYSACLVAGLWQWPVAREYIGLHRIVDAVMVGVALLWLLMFLVWLHEHVKEQALRLLPAILSSPLWLPPMLLGFLILLVATVLLLGTALALTPLGVLAVLVGMGSSWWCSRRGITLRCIKGECVSERRGFRDLEIRYVCTCGTRYGFLVPSHLGFLHHRCTCGSRLPAWSLLRTRPAAGGKTVEATLAKECPNGHTWGIGVNRLSSRFLAIFGGTSAGKTCFMTMAIDELLKAGAGFDSRSDEERHQENMGILKRGERLPGTQRGVPQAMTLILRDDKGPHRRLYFYDAAGEDCSEVGRELGDQFAFFEDLTGILLIVDPLSFQQARQETEMGQPVDWDHVGASEMRFERVLAGLTKNVREFLRLGRSGRMDVPLAVVISKADEFVVQKRIPLDKVDNLNESDLCRRALRDWGAQAEVVKLESAFRRIRYFACSPLGRRPDGSGHSFQQSRVMVPLRWLLDDNP